MSRSSLHLLLAIISFGARTMAESGDHEPTRRTLTSAERRAIYFRLIESFVGHVEDSGRFDVKNGSFDASGTGVTWARGNGALCLGYAVILASHPERQRFTKHGIPQAVLIDRVRRAVRSLCLANRNCSRHDRARAAEVAWGGPSWQAALEWTAAAWAAHLIEGRLDSDTLALVQEVTCAEADHLDKPIPSARGGNTAAEDCCWNAALAAFAANKYPEDPRAGNWGRLARRWALNACSVEGDRAARMLIDGRPLGEWIESVNVYPDLTLENHGFWSAGYQFTYGMLGQAEIAYRAFGRDVPGSFFHRSTDMWEGVCRALTLWDGDVLFPHGQDWGWKDYRHLHYLAWQATCRANPDAGAFESRALQMTLARQLAAEKGGLDVLDFGYQTAIFGRWAFAALMHELSPASAPREFAAAEKACHGIRIYPYVKTAIHRNESKLVSVSWHPRSQAILVLPEGDSTFDHPPFFVPNDGAAAVPAVSIRVTEAGSVTASSSDPDYPPSRAIDRSASTFWASAGSRPGDGPTRERPEWLCYDFEKPQMVTGVVVTPRLVRGRSYGPRHCDLQVSCDGRRFETIRELTLDATPNQRFELGPTTGRAFRLVVYSAYDPRSPDRPRSVQISEIDFLGPRGNGEVRAVPHAGPDRIEDVRTAERDGRLHVSYRRVWGTALTQLVTVVSMESNATAYLTAFRSSAHAEVAIGPLFSVGVAAPSGFERPVRQDRGENWLNMSDHLAFVSADPLPPRIPSGRFALTEERTWRVRPGEWFSPAAVVIYTHQPGAETSAAARQILRRGEPEAGTLLLEIPQPSGSTPVEVRLMCPSRRP